jgi:DNA polymerase-3 subunit alpha
MGKKKPEEMAKMKAEFMAGAKLKKHGEEFAGKIFDLLAKFAGYGFNKSHAAAYSYIAYQTAYLKAHHPPEFMAANMTTELSDTDRVVVLMADCKRMGIKVLPPDINKSWVDFRAAPEGIMFGLGAIKNVGTGAVETIIREREKSGPFRTIFDFCQRIDLHVINKRVIESLIFSGALDNFQGNRAQLFAALEMAMEFGTGFQRDRESGQVSLFDGGGDASGPKVELAEPTLPDVEPLTYAEILKREKETLGFYVSGHPLRDVEDEITGFSTLRLLPEEVKTRASGDKVVVGGIIVGVRRIMDKKGKPMAFAQMESFDGTIEALIFSSVFESAAAHIAEDSIILVSGALDKTNEANPKIIAERILPVAEAREKLTKSVHVRFKTVGLEADDLAGVKKVCTEYPGPCTLIIHAVSAGGSEFMLRAPNMKIGHSSEFLLRLRDIAGKENVWLGRDY